METMIKTSDWFAVLPGACFYVKPPTWIGPLVYYALVFGTLTGWLFAPRRRLVSAGALGLVAAAGVLQWQVHRNDTRITVLPLGGGDSIYVDAPGRTNDLLIDCGNESAAQFVVKPFLGGQGVNHLPRLLLTHGDLRHIGGANLIGKEFSAGQVLASNVSFRSPAYRRIVDDFSRSPERLRHVNRDGRFGNWRVLHPGIDDHSPDADDNAIVLLGEFQGVRVLFCSDLGRRGQGSLLDHESDLGADVLVTGIPGRGEPVCDALLDAVQPRAIIVSASEVPAQERATKDLRERLERRGVPVFYTSDDGAVSITVRPKNWEVRAMSGKRYSAGGN
jgi:competence protein ComEC